MESRSLKEVYFGSSHLITALGEGVEEHFNKMSAAESGIKEVYNPYISTQTIHVGAISEIIKEELNQNVSPSVYTFFEQLLIRCIEKVCIKSDVSLTHSDTLLILTTTKGNIDLIDRNQYGSFPEKRIELYEAANTIADYFKTAHPPKVISNACISGSLGIILAGDLIRASVYKNVIVAGADILSKFTINGFLSFKAVSQKACLPFDRDRAGISPGEAAGAILISDKPGEALLVSGASANDAFHISAPERSGRGLRLAIQKCLSETTLKPEFINAHGTATPYNDEMECRALKLLDLHQIPLNSFKGYWGHTFGAAGVIETIMTLYSLQKQILFPSVGFSNRNDYNELNIIEKLQPYSFNQALKIASGFGGCNASLMIQLTPL